MEITLAIKREVLIIDLFKNKVIIDIIMDL